MTDKTKFIRFIDKAFPDFVYLYLMTVNEPLLKRLTRYAIIAPLKSNDVVLISQSHLGVISFSRFCNLTFALNSIASKL